MDLTKLRTDPAARDEGIWIDLPGDPLAGTSEGAQLKLRSQEYPPYRRAAARVYNRLQPVGRMARDGADPIQLEIEVGKLIAKHLILDWKNIEMNGAVVPFTTDAAERLLTDPDLKDFYEAVGEALRLLRENRSAWENDRKKGSSTASEQT